MSALLVPQTPVAPETLETLFGELIDAHPALRSTIDVTALSMTVCDTDDAWNGLERIAIESTAEIESYGERIQGSLNLESGPLMRTVLFENGEQQWLLLTVHHIVSDRLSLLVLLDQLNHALPSAVDGKTPNLSLPTSGFGAWIGALSSWAKSDEAAQTAQRWRGYRWDDVQPLVETDEPNLNRDADGLRVRLDANLSQALLRNEIGRPDELITLALASEVAAITGSSVGLLEALSHGRRIGGLETSRSVGMFLNYAPLLLDRLDDPGSLHKAVDDLRSQQESAWSFDVLRYFAADEDVRGFFDEVPRAQVLFNFVGRSLDNEETPFLAFDHSPHGSDTDPDGRRAHQLAVMAEVHADETIELAIVHSTKFWQSNDAEQFGRSVTDRLAMFMTAAAVESQS